MKSFMFLSFLVFATITTSVHCKTDPTQQVRDTDENLVRVNTSYYIIPLTKETGGGLALRNTTHESCPLGIFQEVEDNENLGTPVSFYPINPKRNIIRVSIDLNIEFTESPVGCDKSNVWKVDNNKQDPNGFYIATGGVKGNPSLNTVSNWFKIEKFESGYKLIHCPSVAKDEDDNNNNDEDEVPCKNVGLLNFNGQQRLALSDTPFGFEFQKA